ncbi:hypothetical protein AO254_02335 [Pseudomonas syringae]|nr:hypothetical protein AO254_02335 [Pseudomonas syringae]
MEKRKNRSICRAQGAIVLYDVHPTRFVWSVSGIVFLMVFFSWNRRIDRTTVVKDSLSLHRFLLSHREGKTSMENDKCQLQKM